jgi:hypothetical protein
MLQLGVIDPIRGGGTATPNSLLLTLARYRSTRIITSVLLGYEAARNGTAEHLGDLLKNLH